MITLSFYQQPSFNIASIPKQWKSDVNISESNVNGIVQNLVQIQVTPDDSSYRYRSLMQKPQLVLKFSLPFFIEFPVGTTCVYQNQRFILTNPENLKRQGHNNIEYTMMLGTNEDYMSGWKFRNTVDRRLKFSLCAKPHEFIEEIVKNLNARDKTITWEVGECIESTEKTVEFNHVYIDAALTDVANVFETEYEVEYIGTTTAKIHLRKVEYFKEDPVALSYGRGNGFVPGIGRASDAGDAPVKRMYVQGSNRNIDRSKYGAPELLLPKSQTLEYEGHTYQSDADGYYIERIDTISSAIKDDSLDCSEIYPSRVGTVSSVIAVKPEKNYYDIIDNTIPSTLNFNDYLIAGESMTIIFQSGMLSGKEFDVKYKHDERRFEIVPQEIDGVTMPNATYCPETGQKYAIFGIMLPNDYICNNTEKTGASWDMFRAAAKALYECGDQKFTFSGQLQSLWTKRNWLSVGGHLVLGGYVLFTDNQFAVDGVKIRIVGIKDYVNKPYSPTIELSNSVTGASLTSSLREINNTEIIVDDTKREIIEFTKRRFRDAKETIEMLEDAMLDNFTHSISPIAVQTMAMLVGDESLQFQFIGIDTNGNSTVKTNIIGYNQQKKQLIFNASPNNTNIYLQHLTLGINSISGNHNENEYKKWKMKSFISPVLSDGSKRYYLYAKCDKNQSLDGEIVLSETAIGMDSDSQSYHFLVGVLNTESNGERSFATLYGFTEILPGRISTDIIISNDGKTWFDLVKGEIHGNIRFTNDKSIDDVINEYNATIIEGDKIRTDLIDVTKLVAKQLEVVNEHGAGIRIVPNDNNIGSVSIYDEDGNEVSVFEGAKYSSIDDLYENKTESIPIITMSSGCVELKSTDENRNFTHEIHRISNIWYSATPCAVFLLSGDFHCYVSAASYFKKNGDTNSFAKASISVYVKTYEDAECTKLKHSSRFITQCSGYKAGDLSRPDLYLVNGGYEDIYIDCKNKHVVVPNGFHRIELQYSMETCREGSHAIIEWGTSLDNGEDISAESRSYYYVSRFFANGYCLGLRRDNYIMAWNDGENMNFALETNGYGFKVLPTGISYRPTANGDWKALT